MKRFSSWPFVSFVDKKVFYGLLGLALLCVPAPLLAALDTDAPTTRILWRLQHYDSVAPHGSSLSLQDVETAFKKEPESLGKSARRGVLPLGQERNRWIGYVWDSQARKLYLDTNRNLDLTDDAPCVFEVKGDPGYETVNFTPELTSGSEVLRPRLEMRFYPHTKTPMVRVTSGWQGEGELFGEIWQLTVSDSLDGVFDSSCLMALQPMSQLHRPAQPNQLFEGVRSMPLPKLLMLHGVCYELRFSPPSSAASGSKEIEAELAECQPVLAEVQIQGGCIRRLQFSSPECLAIVDSPTSSIHLPAISGSYQTEVWLQDAEGLLLHTTLAQQTAVAAGSTRDLKLGAPLKGLPSAKRSGAYLQIDYSLVGLGGETYSPSDMRHRVPPAFVISKNGRQLASGKLEYG